MDCFVTEMAKRYARVTDEWIDVIEDYLKLNSMQCATLQYAIYDWAEKSLLIIFVFV
jgi:hypothetical protein